MKSLVLLIVHSLVLIVKALRPGGVKALIAENLLLKHQLGILTRARRLFTVAIIIKPATRLKFHRALVKRKYALSQRRVD